MAAPPNLDELNFEELQDFNKDQQALNDAFSQPKLSLQSNNNKKPNFSLKDVLDAKQMERDAHLTKLREKLHKRVQCRTPQQRHAQKIAELPDKIDLQNMDATYDTMKQFVPSKTTKGLTKEQRQQISQLEALKPKTKESSSTAGSAPLTRQDKKKARRAAKRQQKVNDQKSNL